MAEHEARICERRNTYKILGGKLHLGLDIRVNILKYA